MMDIAAYLNWFATGVLHVMPSLCELFKGLPEDTPMQMQMDQVRTGTDNSDW